MNSVIGHCECFTETFCFVVTTAGPNWVNISAVGLGLRMHQGITVNLASGRQKKDSPIFHGAVKKIACASAANRQNFEWHGGEVIR